MLITNIYNMADSYFVSQVSLSAGGATSIVFGIMSIIQAFGFMFGHGAGSHISRQLGGKHIDKANNYASTGFFTAIWCGIVIMSLGLIFSKPLMLLLGSTPTILPHAMKYAFWIFLAAPAMTASCVLNNILRYEGKATLAMIGLTTGGILNIGIQKAREIQIARQGKLNSNLTPEEISFYCKLHPVLEEYLANIADKYDFSTRAVHSCIKLARTIADMQGFYDIKLENLEEAVFYRKSQGMIDML